MHIFYNNNNILIQHFPCAKNILHSFNLLTPFPSRTREWLQLLLPFYRCGNWGPEGLRLIYHSSSVAEHRSEPTAHVLKCQAHQSSVPTKHWVVSLHTRMHHLLPLKVEIWLIYNVLLVSSVQQSDSVMYTGRHDPPQAHHHHLSWAEEGVAVGQSHEHSAWHSASPQSVPALTAGPRAERK